MPLNIVVEAKLCQYTSKPDSLDDTKPMAFKSGKVSNKQCNYAALVREAFAISKKLSFYL